MFTGLVQGIGRVVNVERLAADGGVRLTIDAGGVPGFRAAPGDSIALNGAISPPMSASNRAISWEASSADASTPAGSVSASLAMSGRIAARYGPR